MALLVLAPLFFWIPSLGGRDLPAELFVFGHLGFFALFALYLRRQPVFRHMGHLRGSAAVLTASLAVGAAIEAIQPLFGRGASGEDLWRDGLGAALTLAVATPGRWRRVLVTVPVLTLFLLELQRPAASLWDRYRGALSQAGSRQVQPVAGADEGEPEAVTDLGLPEGSIHDLRPWPHLPVAARMAGPSLVPPRGCERPCPSPAGSSYALVPIFEVRGTIW